MYMYIYMAYTCVFCVHTNCVVSQKCWQAFKVGTNVFRVHKLIGDKDMFGHMLNALLFVSIKLKL